MAGRTSFRKSIAFGGASTAGMMALGLISSVAIARVFGVRTLGLFALAQAPSVALSYLSSVREQAALVRRLALLEPRAELVTGLFAAVFAFSAGLTTVVALLVVGLTLGLYSTVIDQPGVLWPAMALILSAMTVQNVTWNLEMVLSSFRAGRELMTGRLLQAVTFLVVAVVGGLVWDSVWALVVATAGSWTVSSLLRLWQVRAYMRFRVPRDVVRIGFRELPAMLRFGVRLAPSGIANGLSTQAGVWFLSALAPVTAVGAYNRAQMLSMRFMDASMRLSEVLLPTLVERGVQGDRRGHDVAVMDSIRYSAFALLLPAAVGGGAAVGVMDLFGPGFDEAAGALVAVLLVPPLAAVASAQSQVLVAADQPWRVSVISLGRCVITVAVTWLAVQAFGVWGAGAGWVVGYAVAVAWQHWDMRGHLSEPVGGLWPLRQLAVLPVAYAAGFAAARAVDSAVPGLGGLALALAAGTLAYLVALIALGGTGSRDRERLEEARRRFGQRRASRSPVGVEG